MIGVKRVPRSQPSKAADVGDGGELFGERGQLVVDDRQRIAAAEEHFIDGWVGGEPFEGGGPGVERSRGFVVRVVAAEAVTAMDGAGPGGDEQGAAGVLLEQAGLAPCGPVAYRVGGKAGRGAGFLVERQDLAEQRVGRVAGDDAGEEFERGEDGKVGGGAPRRFPPAIVQPDGPAEFVGVADRGLHCLAPIPLAGHTCLLDFEGTRL
jgi:hypothetical protein